MTTANKLTIMRIALIPVFLVVLYLDFAGARWWALGIFIVACLTDFADGYIARHYNQITNFGKFMDPLADKMLTMTAFIFMVALNLAPAWVVAIIVCRELAVTGLRLIVVENNGKVMAAAMPGKIKTTCQMLSIIFLLFGDIFHLGTILLYLALIFTIYSGYDYFHSSWDVFKGSM